MANQDNIITIIGNVVEKPDLRHTGNGVAVCSIRVAHTSRFMKGGEWVDGDTLFITGNAWRDLAERIASTFDKGDRAVLIGRLRSRSYEDREGITKWVTEIELDEAAASVRFTSWTKDSSSSRGGGGYSGASSSGGNGGGGNAMPPAPQPDDVPF